MSERAEPLLTASEVAAVLGFKPGTILDQFERGDLPGFKLPNGAVRFRLTEVEAWLDRCRRGPDVRLSGARVARDTPKRHLAP